MESKTAEVVVTKMTDQAREEMVYDAKTARAIAHEASDSGVVNDALVASIFANIQLERRLASHNPARKTFNSDPS